jgi:hypothetical protein
MHASSFNIIYFLPRILLMRETNATVPELSEVIQTCLNEALQSAKEDTLSVGEEEEKCRSTLKRLPLDLQEAICDDPIATLLKEKNVFTLGKNFFKEKATDVLGCNVASQLILKPFSSIQQHTCQMIDPEKNREIKNFAPGLESIHQECSVLVSKESKKVLADCFPSYNVTVGTEEIKESLALAGVLCREKMTLLSLGEKIKICDDIFKAFTPEFKETSISDRKLNFYERLARFSKSHSIQLKRDNRHTPNISNEQRSALQIQKYFLGHRIIEKAACNDLGRKDRFFKKDKPLFDLVKLACFFPTSIRNNKQHRNASYDSLDSYDTTCKSYTENLSDQEKTQLCREPSQIFHDFRSERFFARAIRSIYRLCNALPTNNSFSEEENIGETLTIIKNSNKSYAITNVSLPDRIEPEFAYSRNSLSDYAQQQAVFIEYSTVNGTSLEKNLTATAIKPAAVTLGTLDAVILSGIAAIGTTGLIALGFWAKRFFTRQNDTTTPEQTAVKTLWRCS